jgi:hypothetical protein
VPSWCTPGQHKSDATGTHPVQATVGAHSCIQEVQDPAHITALRRKQQTALQEAISEVSKSATVARGPAHAGATAVTEQQPPAAPKCAVQKGVRCVSPGSIYYVHVA